MRIPRESQVSKEEYHRSWCTVNQLRLSDPVVDGIFAEQWEARELELLSGDYQKKGGIKASRAAIFLYTIMQKELIEDHRAQL